MQDADLHFVQSSCGFVAQTTNLYKISTVMFAVASIHDTIWWTLWPFQPWPAQLTATTYAAGKALIHLWSTLKCMQRLNKLLLVCYTVRAAWYWELVQAKHCMLPTTNVIERTTKGNHTTAHASTALLCLHLQSHQVYTSTVQVELICLHLQSHQARYTQVLTHVYGCMCRLYLKLTLCSDIVLSVNLWFVQQSP